MHRKTTVKTKYTGNVQEGVVGKARDCSHMSSGPTEVKGEQKRMTMQCIPAVAYNRETPEPINTKERSALFVGCQSYPIC